ncbi:hypothetical protein V2O64_13550 [Verrucomicrobiaceae bacterium 227]
MISSGEYRLQTILAILQSLAVICGALVFRTLVKVVHPALGQHDTLAGFPVFLFDSSAFLLLIPISWVIFTIRKEGNPRSSWSSKHTLISGIMVIVAILAAFAIVTQLATRSLKTIAPLN